MDPMDCCGARIACGDPVLCAGIAGFCMALMPLGSSILYSRAFCNWGCQPRNDDCSNESGLQRKAKGPCAGPYVWGILFCCFRGSCCYDGAAPIRNRILDPHGMLPVIRGAWGLLRADPVRTAPYPQKALINSKTPVDGDSPFAGVVLLSSSHSIYFYQTEIKGSGICYVDLSSG